MAATVPSQPLVFGDPQLHTDGDLLSLAFAADGSLWSVEEPGVVRRWDPLTGRQASLQQLSDLETLWALSGDGRLLAAASNDLAIWESATGRLVAALPQPHWVTAVAFDSAGRVATGHDDGHVGLWDLGGRGLVRTIAPHRKGVSAVAFSPDGSRLASAGEDKTVVVSRTGDGQVIRRLAGHADRIPQLVWHPDGRRVISAGWDATARVWDAESGETTLLLNTHSGQVLALAVSGDGRLLASADSSGAVHVWSLADFKRLHALDAGAGELHCLAFSPDGRYLACGGADRRIHLWDLQSARALTGPRAAAQVQTDIALSGDGKRLVTNGGRGCRVWDTATGQTEWTLAENEAIGAVGYSPDGRWIAGAAGRFVRVWDGRTGQFHATLPDHEQPVTVLAFSPDSATLAAGSATGMGVWLWDVAAAEPKLLIPDALDGCVVHALAWHPAGRLLAVGGIDWMATSGSDGAISFWDVVERCETATFGGGTTALAFDPSGDRLVSASLDHALIVWDTATQDDVGELDGHQAAINALAFRPDGKVLASGGDDRAVRLWEADTGDPLDVRELDSQVKALAFAPDGRTLYTGNGNTTCYRLEV
jgi:WD40 repeat protein